MLKEYSLSTKKNQELVDITPLIKKALIESKINKGLLTVFCPHTTAAITINENADPDVKSDIIYELDKIIPKIDNYKHSEGNSAAHIKSSLLGPSETIIIENGQLVLGTWQGILFCEFDGPRNRKFFVKLCEK